MMLALSLYCIEIAIANLPWIVELVVSSKSCSYPPKMYQACAKAAPYSQRVSWSLDNSMLNGHSFYFQLYMKPIEGNEKACTMNR